MKIKILLFSFLIYVLPFTSTAQLGKELQVGLLIPSISTDVVGSSGNLGFSINYNFFAKYSEKLEWSSGLNYQQASINLEAYSYKRDQIDFNKYKYTKSEVSFSYNAIALHYKLGYYVIPDQAMLFLGYQIAMNFGSIADAIADAGLNSQDGQVLATINMAKETKDPSTGYKSNQVYDLSQSSLEVGPSLFSHGPFIGASYTYNEKYTAGVQYHLFLNNYFKVEEDRGGGGSVEETDISTFLGDPSLRFIHFYLAYKFLPSGEKRRF